MSIGEVRAVREEQGPPLYFGERKTRLSVRCGDSSATLECDTTKSTLAAWGSGAFGALTGYLMHKP